MSDDDEIECVGFTRGPVFVHAHNDCPLKGERTTPCEKCYCCVCDAPVSTCASWALPPPHGHKGYTQRTKHQLPPAPARPAPKPADEGAKKRKKTSESTMEEVQHIVSGIKNTKSWKFIYDAVLFQVRDAVMLVGGISAGPETEKTFVAKVSESIAMHILSSGCVTSKQWIRSLAHYDPFIGSLADEPLLNILESRFCVMCKTPTICVKELMKPSHT